MSSVESSTEHVISPVPTGTARWWLWLAHVSKAVKGLVPSALQSTLNRQLWLFAGMAVFLPAFVALYEGAWLTLGSILLVTFVVGGGVYGEMYIIIETLQSATNAISDETYDFEIAEQRGDGIDDVYRGLETTAADLDERIAEAQEATTTAKEERQRAEEARQEAEQARQAAEETAEQLQTQAREFSAVMETVADGDLTRRLDTDADNEAMAEIATSFNAMLDSLETTVAEVTQFAEEAQRLETLLEDLATSNDVDTSIGAASATSDD